MPPAPDDVRLTRKGKARQTDNILDDAADQVFNMVKEATPNSRKRKRVILDDDPEIIRLMDEMDEEDGVGLVAASDGDVVVLDEAPKHMRRITNRDNPIELDDSSDEEGAGPVKSTMSFSRAQNKRARFNLGQAQPQAGPSRSTITRQVPRQMQEDLDFDFGNIEDLERLYTDPWADDAEHLDDGNGNAHAGPSRATAGTNLSVAASPAVGGSSTSAVPVSTHFVNYAVYTTAADFLPHVLDILPDVDTDWATERLELHYQKQEKDKVVESLISEAFEMDGGYPKAGAKGKEAAQVPAPSTTYADVDHRKQQRTGSLYYDKTYAALQDHYPQMPAQHIASVLQQNSVQYFPTFWALRLQEASDEKPYTELKNKRASKGAIPKRKDRNRAETDSFVEAMSASASAYDGGWAEWLMEHDFLEAAVAQDEQEKSEAKAKQAVREAALAEGGVECGCCFGEELLEDMFQCSEGHLFCKECCVRNAETKLGEQSTTISCMDMSGCIARFPETELARALPTKTLELYFRLKLAAELVLAGIEGLETCPACDYAVVIDNPDEKLFSCMNDQCKQVSCRKCRHKEHLPKSCEEMEADRKLDKRHAIEDAMTAALVRKCPKCAKPYLKESGCNKITCSGCHTKSCYICQQTITDYTHFDQSPSNYRAPKDPSKCRLWDPNEAVNDQEAVVRARDAARQDVERAAAAEGIALAAEDLDVAAPDPPPAAAARAVPQGHAADLAGLMARDDLNPRMRDALAQFHAADGRMQGLQMQALAERIANAERRAAWQAAQPRLGEIGAHRGGVPGLPAPHALPQLPDPFAGRYARVADMLARQPGAADLDQHARIAPQHPPNAVVIARQFVADHQARRLQRAAERAERDLAAPRHRPYRGGMARNDDEAAAEAHAAFGRNARPARNPAAVAEPDVLLPRAARLGRRAADAAIPPPVPAARPVRGPPPAPRAARYRAREAAARPEP